MALDPDSVLRSARLKVERAYGHIDCLRRDTEPLNPKFYSVMIQEQPLPPLKLGRGVYVIYQPREPIADTLALTIGDAVHNLRSALDHLANGIVRTIQNPPGAHFPVHSKRKQLETDGSLALIEKALPGAKKLFLEQIRPENGPNEALWSFTSINNSDKHNDLVPTVAVSAITGVDVLWGGLSITNNTQVANADAPAYLTVLQGVDISQVTIQNDAAVTVDVRFGQGTTFENQPVVPTLLQFAELVGFTLDEFQKLMEAGRSP